MGWLGGVTDLMRIETRWTMLPPPSDAGHPGWESSWRYLFVTYRPAMTRYVRTILSRLLRRPVEEAEAEDVVQEYLSQCMEKGWLSRDAVTIRSFRRYLKTQLFRFTHDYLDRQLAQKRGGGSRRAPIELADLAAPAADEAAAEELDRAWMDVALEQALMKLAAQNEVHATVIRDLVRTQGEGSADVHRLVGKEARQMPVIRYRARKAFAMLFAEELQATVTDLEAYAELLEALAPHLP